MKNSWTETGAALQSPCSNVCYFAHELNLFFSCRFKKQECESLRFFLQVVKASLRVNDDIVSMKKTGI